MGARGLEVSDYEYELPEGRVAKYPLSRRDESRLLAVPRGGGATRHLFFRDLPGLTEPGDVLVVNDSKVLPARLLGRKPTGAQAEILLLRPASDGPHRASIPANGGLSPDPGEDRTGEVPVWEVPVWEALVRPGGKLKPGRTVVIAPDLVVHVLDSTSRGTRLVRLETPLPVDEALAKYGHVPLPPYLDRPDEAVDRERYQTVYARTPGSVAAPTAGLHFTPELMATLVDRGVEVAKVTLHVGVGTFRPVEVDDPAQHILHEEHYEIPAAAARTVMEARKRGGRVWAVGTTVVRTLESATRPDGTLRVGGGVTDLFVRPPYEFRAVDALVTNFHLPRSTLLMLVAAFAGHAPTMEAYREAVAEGYRFYSYGDAMVVW